MWTCWNTGNWCVVHLAGRSTGMFALQAAFVHKADPSARKSAPVSSWLGESKSRRMDTPKMPLERLSPTNCGSQNLQSNQAQPAPAQAPSATHTQCHPSLPVGTGCNLLPALAGVTQNIWGLFWMFPVLDWQGLVLTWGWEEEQGLQAHGHPEPGVSSSC